MCFTYLQENSSSQTNGLKRRLSQGSIYLYVVLHLLVAARFAFQFWKHVWFAFYICNVLMFTDPDSIVLLFSSSFLSTVKLLPLLLWIHIGRGLIALDTFYDYFNFVLFSLRYEYLPNILRTGSTVFTCRVYSEHSPIPEVSYPPSLRHLFEQKVRRLGRLILFFYHLFRKGGRNHPFIFFFFISPLSNFHWTNVSIRGLFLNMFTRNPSFLFSLFWFCSFFFFLSFCLFGLYRGRG